MKNKQQTAEFFGCTLGQLNKQYQSNYEVLLKMFDKAKSLGKKVNGYTEEQLSEMVNKYKELANG